MTEREFAVEVVERLQNAGFVAYWAGGCVRDELLGLTPADYDVGTNATPEQVRHLFRRTVEVGLSFGVVEVLGPKPLKVQVATFRCDGDYSDGRRPDHVAFSSAEEDAKRRDFTINGMFFDPLTETVFDFVGGQDDLAKRRLRAIGNPHDRFREDKLRLLRAARMAARFDLTIETETFDAVKAMAPQITVVSAERIADELRKMLVHPRRARSMELLRELGLIGPILKESAEMIGLPQGLPDAPTGDLWQHVMKVLDVLEGPTWPGPQPVSFPLAFAALLHDVGKRRTAGRTPDRYTFHGHEHVGRRMAEVICSRLKLSNAEKERIEWLVERHQYLCEAPAMRASKLKPILVHPGIGELLALHKADSIASGRSIAHVEFCEQMLRTHSSSELNPPPLITGDDLIALGVKRGPQYKELLDAVREAQLEGIITTREEAIELVKRLLEGNK